MEKGNTGRAYCEVAHFGVNKQNIIYSLYYSGECPQNLDSIDLMHQEVDNMTEEGMDEKIKLEDNLKKVICKLRMFLMTYDPDKYDVDILVANKDEWIKKVEDGHVSVHEVMFHIQDSRYLSAADKENLAIRTIDLQKDVVEFITKFNKKILKNTVADVENHVTTLKDDLFTVDTKSVELPGAGFVAEVSQDIHSEIPKQAALVKIEPQTMDVVTSSVEENAAVVYVEYPMILEIFMNAPVSHRKENPVAEFDTVVKYFWRLSCANYYERGKLKLNSVMSMFPFTKRVSHSTLSLLLLDQLLLSTCLGTDLDTGVYNIILSPRLKWVTLPHSQVRVAPGNLKIHVNLPSSLCAVFITDYAG